MLKQSDFVKIIIAVPVKDASKVRQAMGDAGAGMQGNYSHCSGSYLSVGRFTPLSGAQPTIGEINKPEEVEEEIMKMLCHINKVKTVIIVLKEIHPYEEPAIDIFPRLEVI